MTETGLTFRERKATTRVILHTSARVPPEVTDTLAWLRAKGRTMGLLEVGYHAVIEKDGMVHFPRGLNVMGSHAPGANHDSVGVFLAGFPHEVDEIPQAQLFALRALVTKLRLAFPGIQVVGRKEAIRERGVGIPMFDMDELRSKLP